MKKTIKFIALIFLGIKLTSCNSTVPQNTSSSEFIPNESIKYELPQDTTNTNTQILENEGFVISYNLDLKAPNWVAWELTCEETRGNVKRTDWFTPDERIPQAYRVYHSDFSDSGYDRGHMFPAGDARWSKQAMLDCFNMTNMCMQLHELNDEGWRVLEESCRRWACTEGSLYIVCGPIFNNEKSPNRYRNKVAIPEGFFKVVMSLRPGHERAIGFIYENSAIQQQMRDCAVSIDKIEEITGLNFFYNLPDELENKIERMSSFDRDWNLK